MKKNIKLCIVLILGIIIGITCFTYAETYNSSDIAYDNGLTEAKATNVKEAMDYLYKVASGMCPEGMTCIKGIPITLNVNGSGTVSNDYIGVPIGLSSTFTVTPNSGYYLHEITCSEGYELLEYKTAVNDKTASGKTQTITIRNNGTEAKGECNISFGLGVEVNLKSTHVGGTYSDDTCNSENVGCACYYINKYSTGVADSSHRGEKFNYDGHIGCKFKSHNSYSGFDKKSSSCNNLWWGGPQYPCWSTAEFGHGVTCSGVLVCET